MADSRQHKIDVRLNDDELALLEERCPPGISKPAFLRSLIHAPRMSPEIASRDEVLGILTSLARDGRVSAAIALAHELRGEQPPRDEGESEMDQLLGGWEQEERARGPVPRPRYPFSADSAADDPPQ